MEMTILILFLFFLAACIFVVVRKRNGKADFVGLNGTLLVQLENKKAVKRVRTARVAMITPKNNSVRYLAEYGSASVFSKDMKKAFGISFKGIVETDLTTRAINEWQISNQEIEKGSICNIQVAGTDNKISFINANNQKMYLFDAKDQALEKLDSICINGTNCPYCWTADGKFLYYTPYSQKNKVVRYDRKTGKEEILFDGSSPMLSQDNKMIAYLKNDSGETNTLVIRSMDEKLTWEYRAKEGRIGYYKFSPDNSYVAVFIESASPFYGSIIKIVNFKAGKETVVADKLTKGYSKQFDWR